MGSAPPMPPSVVSGGGPGGAADPYMRISSSGGSGPGSRLVAKWTHLDSNQTVAEETKDVAAGAQTTDFHISNPDGWPTGRYRVEVSQDGNVISSSEFDVR